MNTAQGVYVVFVRRGLIGAQITPIGVFEDRTIAESVVAACKASPDANGLRTARGEIVTFEIADAPFIIVSNVDDALAATFGRRAIALGGISAERP